MSTWRDPFYGDDPAAREREERRAAREARRRERLARRVQADAAVAEPAQADPPRAEPPAQPPTSPLPPANESPPRREEPPEPEPPQRPPSLGGPPEGPAHRRRLLAVFGVLALAFAALAVVVIARHDGGKPAPPPVRPAKTIDLTIPEGYRIAQIAEIARKDGLRGSYEDAAKHVKGFDPARYGATDPANLEGFLFPATYNLFRHAKVGDLVSKQLDAFRQNIAGVDMGYARSKNLTTFDVLTIASMVQAEAGNAGEMDEIAEVIYNRLHAGIPLGIDATIRYATGNYTQPLTESQLAVSSPYNTRLNAGLPPGPIDNPGLAAIEAAAKPGQGDLLYFVAKPGTCGHAFFVTEAEFDAAVARYNAAREAAGGKSPTSC